MNSINNYREIIVISAYFRVSNILYQQYELKSTSDLEFISNLIKRARGKADLRRRSYSVSQSLASDLNKFIDQLIEWDFKKFYYQIGVMRRQSQRPDGFLLAEHNYTNGKLVNYYSAENPFNVDIYLGIVDKSSLNHYEEVHINNFNHEKLFDLFPEIINRIKSKKYYYELYPFLSSHIDFYIKKYKLKISNK